MSTPIVIKPGTPADWQAYYLLRYEVLRKPWGQGAPDRRESDEDVSIHGLVKGEDGRAIAVGRIHRLDEKTVQIRFMAVDEAFRGKSLGKIMLDFLEGEAKKQFSGIETILLQARENAIPFYLRNGYEIVEKTFLLFDSIQHFLMKKSLFPG